jgi:hypothetical protein
MSDDSRRDAAMMKLAADILAWGLRIVESHQGSLVYRKSVNLGQGESRIVTLHLPGILRVNDARTGVLLAESRPGDLLNLAEGFKPEFPQS